jgi:hypothetical protein
MSFFVSYCKIHTKFLYRIVTTQSMLRTEFILVRPMLSMSHILGCVLRPIRSSLGFLIYPCTKKLQLKCSNMLDMTSKSTAKSFLSSLSFKCAGR